MQSFIAIHSNPDEQYKKAQDVCKTYDIHPMDITVVEQFPTIGIEQVRDIQKKIFLSPFKGKWKAIIIKQADLLTKEAQNALLKILEEPPHHAIIILTTKNKDMLLPTIQSRCVVFNFDFGQKQLPQEDMLRSEQEIMRMQRLTISERLRLAQELSKNKEDALFWLEALLLTAREKLLQAAFVNSAKDSAFLLRCIKSAQKTHTLIQTTNANLRLLLEHFFLSQEEGRNVIEAKTLA